MIITVVSLRIVGIQHAHRILLAKMSNIHFFIDETGTDVDSKIFALGLVILNNPASAEDAINKLKADILHDPRFKTIPTIATLERNGFHYQEDHFEIRNAFIELIAVLSFQSYICFINKDDIKGCEINSKEMQGKLLGRLLFDRLRDLRTEKIAINIEQSSLNTAAIDGIIKQTITVINRSKKKILHSPIVSISSKQNVCLAIADYICGAFRDYHGKLGISETYESRNYDTLRGKIRVVHDFLNDIFYTRRNPLP